MPKLPKADLRIYWSKREKALIYDGLKQAGGLLARYVEGTKIIDAYNMRHGLASGLHHKSDSDERTLAQELEARGYDLSTLKFSIRKKPT